MNRTNQQQLGRRRLIAGIATSLAVLLGLNGTLVSQSAYAQSADTLPGSVLSDALPADASSDAAAKQKEAVATLAGGCFWCTEAVFENMKGVREVVSGYIGGTVPNPTYEQVTGKRTGHAEAVEVYYDPNVVNFEEILEVFFKTHDPTTPNQQGNDYGPQYRSVVFVHSKDQELATKQYIAKLEAKREFSGKIVTEVIEAGRFWEAEGYHQDYYKKNPNAGYCRAVVSKKVKKFDDLFGDKKKQP